MAEDVPMIGRRSCQGCAFHGTMFQQDRTMVAVCRRNAARANAMLVPTGPNSAQVLQQTLWPVVTPDDWCGEHLEQKH